MITGCKNESEILNKNNGILDKNNEKAFTGIMSDGALLEVSYEMTSYVRYTGNFDKLTELDFAHINPSDEKQGVALFLMPDGSVNMSIEKLDFERIIRIPNEIASSDFPEIKRTEIIGNNAVFYDVNRKILGSQQIMLPKQKQLADQIKQYGEQLGYEALAKAYATMQGAPFDQSVEKIITEARAKGQLTEYDAQFATVRTKLSEVNPDAKGANVAIIDRNINKVVASTNYDEKERMTRCTYYGYEKESAPMLNAIRTEQLIQLPSGAEVWQISCTKIENLKLKINPVKS